MSSLNKLIAGEQQVIEKVDMIPPGESILVALAIDPYTLKSIKSHWQRTQYRAVINWLTKYKSQPNASNLEKVKGYLEAFHHLFEIAAWNQALRILVIKILNYENDQLHNQLFSWGYYKEVSALYKKFLDNLDFLNPDYKTIFLYGMGKVYYAQGNLTKAINYYQQALDLARTLPASQQEGAILNGLGAAYQSLGNYTQAIDCYWQDLLLAWKNKNCQGEAAVLNNLGFVFCQQEKFHKAIKYQKESLRILRQSDNPFAEGRVLGSLAQAYGGLEKYDEAIEYHQQHLKIMQKIEDRAGEAEALCNLGITMAKQKETQLNQPLEFEDYSQALQYFEEALEICRAIGIGLIEINVLWNLAGIYQRLGQKNLVLKYSQQALNIANKLGIPIESFKQLRLD